MLGVLSGAGCYAQETWQLVRHNAADLEVGRISCGALTQGVERVCPHGLFLMLAGSFLGQGITGIVLHTNSSVACLGTDGSALAADAVRREK